MQAENGNHDRIAGAAGFADTIFFKKAYKETLAMVHEACNYIDGPGRRACNAMEETDSLYYTAETLRLTTRLTQLMAWMFVQRAVQNGEMTPEEAAKEQHRLGARHTCLSSSEPPEGVLPASLEDLLERSERLYRRVARLDDLLAENGRAA